VVVAASVWRWHLLLGAQGVDIAVSRLVSSYLVALFFNNFLPSTSAATSFAFAIRRAIAGSMTLATTVVLVDRALGLIALVLIAASGASLAAGGGRQAALPILPAWLWAGFFLGAGVSAPAVLAPTGFGRIAPAAPRVPPGVD
jgi:hypothetical protein